jgi:large subunit ribosomal protein L10
MSNIKNQEIVKKLTKKFKAMKGLILTEYRGLTVEEISRLRLKLRPFGSEYIVAKNTLSKIAFKEAGAEAGENFSGSTALLIESEDIVSPAKVVMEFAKTHAKLKIKAGFLEGKFVNVAVVEQLSILPSKEVLVARMLDSMNATITDFLNVLEATIRGLVTVLDVIIKKQEA